MIFIEDIELDFCSLNCEISELPAAITPSTFVTLALLAKHLQTPANR